MAYQAVIEKLPAGNDIDLLLMGKSGHGKSRTGNSILGRNAFRTRDTTRCQIGFSRIDGRVFKVVDIPGLCDTDGDAEEVKTDLVVKAISSGLCQFPQGLTALVLVLSYTRFTQEEQEAIDTLKKILGDDIIRLHTICVITHGDSFKADHGDEDEDFQEWCRGRQGALKSLLQECQYRCVLFDNVTRDPKDKRSQLVNLVSIIDQFQVGKNRYTFEKFSATTGSERERTLPVKLERYSRRNGLIIDDLSKIIDGNLEDNRQNVTDLKQKVKELKDDVDENSDEMFNGMKQGVAGLWARVNLFENAIKEEKWSVERKEREKEKNNVCTSRNKTQQRRETGESKEKDVSTPKLEIVRTREKPTRGGDVGRPQKKKESPPKEEETPRITAAARGVGLLRDDIVKSYQDVVKELQKDLFKTDQEISDAIENTSLAKRLSGFFKELGEKFVGLFS